MKQYSHDYTKIAEVESHLYAAQQLNAHDDTIEAWKHIEDARRLLQEYLSADNMVEDNDVADGLVKANDTFDDEQLDFIRDLFADQLHHCPTSSTAQEQLDIINKCQRNLDCPEFESVEQFANNVSNVWTEIKTED